jgi:putative transferase (TIGR04331 family)
LFDSPESAAHHLNDIYRNPQEWWMRPSVQAAKNRFCEALAQTGNNWIDLYAKALSEFKKDGPGKLTSAE